MASTFSTNLAIELIGTGDQAGTWGVTTNTNLGTLIEQAISGYVTQAVSTGADTTITIPNGATGVARNMYIELTGTGGTNTNLIVPANKKLYFIFNNTSSGQVTVKVSGQTGVSVPNGKKVVLVCNGTDIVNGLNYIADFGTNSFTVTNLTATSATITNLIATTASISDASATVLRSASATITNLIATSASITTLTNNPTFSAGTANGVLYLNGSKVATSGSALVFDGTNLGLGTSNPSGASGTAFVVNGGAGQSRLALKNTNSGDASGDGFQIALLSDGINVVYQNRESGYQSWELAGTEGMRLTSTSFYTASGINVGIGTASPSYKLDVNNGGGSAAGLRVSGNDQANVRMRLENSGSGGRTWELVGGLPGANNANFSIRDVTGSTTPLTIDSSGNLGIGTTSAGYKLQVNAANPANGVIAQFYNNATSSLNGAFAIISQFGVDDWFIGQPAGTSALTFGNGKTSSAGGTERMRLTSSVFSTDSSISVGIGTASPANKLDITGSDRIVRLNSTANNALIRYSTTGTARFSAGLNDPTGWIIYDDAAAAYRVVVDYSGNVGIGTTSPGLLFDAQKDQNSATQSRIRNDNNGTASQASVSASYGDFAQYVTMAQYSPSFTTSGLRVANSSGVFTNGNTNGLRVYTLDSAPLIFGTADTERGRFTAGGEFLVNATSAVASEKFLVRTTAAAYTARFANDSTTAGNCNGLFVWYSSAAPNGTDNEFLRCDDSAATRAEIRSNGGLANYQANDVNLSDERTKKDIAPLGSMWAKIKALEIVTFKYKDQTHDDDNIGLIAQQVESVAPEFVDTDGFGETPEDGVPLKTVYTTDMYHAAIKALQEAMARIEQLEADMAALKASA